jgi:hypothetical protein
VLPLYSRAVLIVPLLFILQRHFGLAVVSVTAIIPRIVITANGNRFRMFISVAVRHVAGALAIGYASTTTDDFVLPYVCTRAIAFESIFSALIAHMEMKRPNLVPIIFFIGWLGAMGGGMPHLSSSISFGSNALSNGRLFARVIGQLAGALFGSVIRTGFIDSTKIDFEEILSTLRTTDGRRIKGE